MDPDTKDLVKSTAAGAAAGTVEGFFNTVGAALVELSQMGVDVIRFQRWKMQHSILERARQFCDARGINPQAIPLKVLVPLVENMSLEEDPEASTNPEGAKAMQERWAALLANAAMGDAGVDVLPGFPRILSELMPEEATMLEWLAGLRAGSTPDSLKAQVGFDWTKPTEGQEVFDVYVGNLERLGLVVVRPPDSRALADVVHGVYGDMGGGPTIERQANVRLTPLGRAFVTACTPPAEVLEGDATT